MESAIAKIDRAKYHLQELNMEIDKAREDKAHGIAFDHEAQVNQLVIRAIIPGRLFNRFALLAGEIIGQARSALEHAIWELVPSPHVGVTGFPVFALETEIQAKALAKQTGKNRRRRNRHRIPRYYDRHGISMIHNIKPNAEAIIRGLQPFGPNPQANLLYILNELWNIDKHRSFNFCIAYMHGIALYYRFPGDRFESQMINLPPKVKDGAELFRDIHPGPEVQMGAEVAFSQIVFDGGLLDGQPLAESLLKLIEFAETIINDLVATI